ncbi:MAG TPA: KpsF/GutQ family sugar-phosphate isomerase [Phycisphaerales bacterium]|nr:KpsF/GutQ family sugar-phosphate isomerase [Phycisphaerales bacterium]
MTVTPSNSRNQDHRPPEGEEAAACIRDVLRSEAEAIQRIADAVHGDSTGGEAARWQGAVDLIASCRGHVVVSGMGKSGLIGAKISATFSSVGIPSNVLHPAEAVHGDLGRIRRDDVVMLLSYSGTTEEVVNLATILKADGVPRLGISGRHDSKLAGLCDVHLALGELEEAGTLNLAPTTSTTATLACGDALAMAVARRRRLTEDEFRRHHPGGKLGSSLRSVDEVMRLRVGENLPVVSQALSVKEALDEAWTDGEHRRAGAIMLVDDRGRLSGIFTDGDLRRLVMDDPRGLDRPIRDVMTKHPRSLRLEDRTRDARQLIAEHRIDEIPVVDDEGRPRGLIDVQDLVTLKIVQE